jgi:hypothetical protein
MQALAPGAIDHAVEHQEAVVEVALTLRVAEHPRRLFEDVLHQHGRMLRGVATRQ